MSAFLVLGRKLSAFLVVFLQPVGLFDPQRGGRACCLHYKGQSRIADPEVVQEILYSGFSPNLSFGCIQLGESLAKRST